MADNIIGDIYNNFERALSEFYEGAAVGISGYVIPIAWVLLGICMLIWCYLIIEGKVAMPMTDWLLKFVGFMVVLYIMGNGYLSWVARPIFDLPTELTTRLSAIRISTGSVGSGQREDRRFGVGNVHSWDRTWSKDWPLDRRLRLFLMGVLVIVAAYLLLAAAMFSVIFSKLGLSMVLGRRPILCVGVGACLRRATTSIAG